MMGNGKMIIIKVMVDCLIIRRNGINIKGNLDVGRDKDLGRYGIKMGISIKGSLGMICCGGREGFFIRMGRLKMGFGRKIIMFRNIHDNLSYLLI